jgi:hypothetical protein
LKRAQDDKEEYNAFVEWFSDEYMKFQELSQNRARENGKVVDANTTTTTTAMDVSTSNIS